MMKQKKYRLMPVIQADASVTREYQKRLRKLIREMAHSVEYWVTAAWNRDTADELAQDADGETIEQAFNRRAMQWRIKFDAEAETIAKVLISKQNASYRRRVNAALKRLGFTVHPTLSQAEKYAVQSAIEWSTSLIKSIQSQYMDETRKLLRKAVDDRDMRQFRDELEKRTNITIRRADFIARDQMNKVMNDLRTYQDKDLGITEGIWIHIPGRKTARSTHAAMNGERFRISEGIFDEDVNRNVRPAELPGCCCMYRGIIPTPTAGGSGTGENTAE